MVDPLGAGHGKYAEVKMLAEDATGALLQTDRRTEDKKKTSTVFNSKEKTIHRLAVFIAREII